MKIQEMKIMINKRGVSIRDIIANIDRKHEWEGNILQTMAEEIVRYAIPLEEVIKNDLSMKLGKEIEREVANKEIVSIQINAKPRMAKSTLAILLGMFIHGLLVKYKMRPEGDRFGIRNIARDQGEKGKKMRNPELMFDIIITDEGNELEDTGENATVEKAQRNDYSNVQAGRYVHGIWVCPEGTMDRNCDIKLEIRNKDKGLVHTRVSYFMKSTLYHGWVLIGIADFDVSKLIKQWLKIEPTFYRYLKDKKEEDRKVIEYWSKRDFYIEYMCKKYEKMELMNREGILHARDLDYAEIRNAIVKSLKPLAELPIISMERLKKNIRGKIEIEFGKRIMPISMLGRELEYERIVGILDMYRSKIEIENSIKNVCEKMKRGKIASEEYNKAITTLETAKDEIIIQIKIAEERLERLEKLNKKYNSNNEKEVENEIHN